MICKQCGKEQPDGATRCGSCGAALKETPPKRKPDMTGLAEVAAGVIVTVKAGWKLLCKGGKKLLRWLYVRLSGMEPESDPNLFDVVVALREFVCQLSRRQRRLFYAGSALALVLVVCLVGGAFSPKGGGGSSGGGGGIWVSNREPYQPEFSKLDCLTCRGDGDCNTCGGYGEVERYAGGGDTVTSKCSSCYGSGNCRTCGGSGKR